MTLKVTRDGTAALRKSLNDLLKKRVLIGIPASENARDDSEIGNAAIGYINEFGAPGMNIPPRPHLVPGVAGAKAKVVPRMKVAAQAALEGNSSGSDAQLETVAQLCADAVVNKIREAEFTPLAERTKAARRAYAKKNGGEVEYQPLQMTGNYRDSIKGVVRDSSKE